MPQFMLCLPRVLFPSRRKVRYSASNDTRECRTPRRLLLDIIQTPEPQVTFRHKLEKERNELLEKEGNELLVDIIGVTHMS